MRQAAGSREKDDDEQGGNQPVEAKFPPMEDKDDIDLFFDDLSSGRKS